MKLWGRFLSILIVAVLAGGIAPASANTSVLSGRVTDDLNKPVANTTVTLTRAGATLGTVRTNATGAYTFSVAPGAYSMRFVPPTTANGTLNAFDIVAPQSRPLAVKLTKPMPGRAFLTGNVTTSPSMKLDADSSIYFANSWSTRLNSVGDYRLTPTAGTNDLFYIKAASGSFSFGLFAQEKLAINQDTIANFVVPVTQQRIRVVNAAGQPIAGAIVDAGQGSHGTEFAPMGVLEGLGAYKAGWKNKGVTDANGFLTITTVRMSPLANAGYQVTPPTATRFMQQSFISRTGAGDVTLVMTNQVSLLSGSVRDQNGVGLAPVDVSFGDIWTTTVANGTYQKPIPDGTKGLYSVIYRAGSFVAQGTGVSLSISPAIGTPVLTATGGRQQDLVLRLDTVRVRVVDSAGLPVARAHVQLTDDLGYAPRGRYTLIPGQIPSIATFNSNAPTDANGFASVRTLRLDTALSGRVTVTPAAGSPLSWKSESAIVGDGRAITVVLSRPTVTVSGKVTLSDGTPAAPYSISFSDGRGGDQGTGIVDPVTGTYTMQVPAGMKGSFWLTCPPNLAAGQYPFCMSFNGGSRTISANTVVDIVIPTEKTKVQVVDPSGKGLAGVNVQIWHEVGLGICTAATVRIFADFATRASNAFSIAVTDANGIATLTTVKMAAPCEANAQLTPDANSRYQTRTVGITISDNTDNLIVLTIPEPIITLGVVSVVGSGANAIRTVNLTGENFLGATAITWNGVAVTNFRVINASRINFVLPADAASTGVVVVTNGGGSSSFTLN
jgi:protocatechuate 3,4-dioxygenase beta subunit